MRFKVLVSLPNNMRFGAIFTISVVDHSSCDSLVFMPIEYSFFSFCFVKIQIIVRSSILS